MAVNLREFMVNAAGSVRVARYDMTVAGDGIAKRWYKGPNSDHSVIMAWGRVLITPTFGDPFEIKAGSLSIWPAGSEYAVSAVEVPVRMFYIFGPNLGLINFLEMTPQEQLVTFQLNQLHEGV